MTFLDLYMSDKAIEIDYGFGFNDAFGEQVEFVGATTTTTLKVDAFAC